MTHLVAFGLSLVVGGVFAVVSLLAAIGIADGMRREGRIEVQERGTTLGLLLCLAFLELGLLVLFSAATAGADTFAGIAAWIGAYLIVVGLLTLGYIGLVGAARSARSARLEREERVAAWREANASWQLWHEHRAGRA